MNSLATTHRLAKLHAQSARPRQGVTLVEVLMSLMIMGIGVTSVATLFPISAIRSAKATKNTNAALLKYNTEARLKSQPWLVFDPDGDATFGTAPNGLIEHFRNPRLRNYVVDPIGYFTALRSADIASPPAIIQNQSFGLIAGTTGVFEQDEEFVAANSPYFLPRFDGAVAINNAGLSQAIHERVARQLASLGDTWTTVIDEYLDSTTDLIAGVNGPVGVVIPSGSDASDLAVGLGTVSVTVFSVDGRYSEKLTVVNVVDDADPDVPSGRQGLRWNTATPLPAVFGGQAGRIVVETKQNSDYHWMLTVRREGDGRTSGVDVVVMFSNGRQPDDERIYPSTFVSGSNQIGLLVPNDADPVLRRGGFVFDIQNARWYRISDVEAAQGIYAQVLRIEGTIAEAGGEDQAILDGTLNSAETDSDGDGVLDANEDLNNDGLWTGPEDRNGNGTLDFGGAVFLPHVVEVFPLGSFPVPDAIIPRNF